MCGEIQLTKIQYGKLENQKADGDLMIGKETKEYIKSGALSAEDIKQFYSTVRNYYQNACSYVITTYPLDDPLIQHAEVLDVSKRMDNSFQSIQYFVERFPCHLGELDTDQLEMEFANYQVDPLSSVSSDFETARIDTKWHLISQIKDPATGEPAYPLLSKVMKGILVIPHSNAACERAFSIVRKNSTEFQPNMSTRTLQSLLTEKMKHQTTCYQRDFKKEFLRKAKQATNVSLTGTQGSAGTSTTKN